MVSGIQSCGLIEATKHTEFDRGIHLESFFKRVNHRSYLDLVSKLVKCHFAVRTIFDFHLSARYEIKIIIGENAIAIRNTEVNSAGEFVGAQTYFETVLSRDDFSDNSRSGQLEILVGLKKVFVARDGFSIDQQFTKQNYVF